MSRVVRRASARRDLVEIFRYLARKSGLGVADRFLDEAEATFARLAGMPGLGTPYDPDEPIFAELRYAPISRFKSYLVFYRAVAGGIEVFRVLHGARDLPGLLSEGLDDEDGDA